MITYPISKVCPEAPKICLMQFILMRVYRDDCNESDFETAVDMSHTTGTVLDVTLQSSGGLTLSVHVSECRTTYTYQEPDFETLERTGEEHWVSHPGEQEADSFSHGHASASLPNETRLIAQDDLKQFDPSDLSALESLKRKFQQPNGDSFEQEIEITLSDELSSAIADHALRYKLRMGKVRVVWFHVTEADLNLIRLLEQKVDEIHAKNLATRVQNIFEVAMYVARAEPMCV